MSKRCFIILLVVFLSLSSSVFAAEKMSELKPLNDYSIITNEYEAVKELSLKSMSELSDMGYNNDEISDIKNYHQVYVNHLNELKLLDNSSLLNHGYTVEQIALLRDFDGGEAQASALSATLSLNVSLVNFRLDSEGFTRGRLSYSWNWSGIPATKLRDSVAACWNDWEPTSNHSDVHYYSLVTGLIYDTKDGEYYYGEHWWDSGGINGR